MKLNFNLEDISYMKTEIRNGDEQETIKLAIREKKENEFIAIAKRMDISKIKIPQRVPLGFICQDGLYSTIAEISAVDVKEDYTYFSIQNPSTLDFQQNREYYRILAEYDCIYTIDSKDGTESYSAVTYDISAGGVSIILSENAISKEECTIVIMLPDGDLKSHVKFVRCDLFDDNYRLSFEFSDLPDREYQRLTQLCINKQTT